MKQFEFKIPLLLILLCAHTFGAVQNARIAQSSKVGKFFYQIDSRYSQHDFTDVFKGVNLAEDGEETDDGVFGHPIKLIVQADEGNFLLYVNNVEDIFSIYRLRKTKEGHFIALQKGSREIRLPGLSAKLRNAGLNLLSCDDLRRIHKLPQDERSQFFKNYRPVNK